MIDIIGDVHGHADRLEALLAKLGYEQRNGTWRHSEAVAIFVGDLIDRGPEQLRTLKLVCAMIDAGAAQMVMGNHELNAIGYATSEPQRSGEFLRRRDVKNTSQHAAFLAEVALDSAHHRSWVEWFLQLPLWIETPELRVVHACWDARLVHRAQSWLRGASRLPADHLPEAFAPGHPLQACIETLLKGPEVPLPEDASFKDKDGHKRTAIRTRWWAPELTTYAQAYIGPSGASIPDLPLPSNASSLPPPDRPTFIGHYWLEPEAGRTLLGDRVVCVDHSVARGGKLAAYRFDGETAFNPERFIAV